MRPDPWQQEKSRKYRLKNRAKLLSKTNSNANAKKDPLKEKLTSSQDHNGFKFVNPTQINVSCSGNEEETENEEDEYDVVDFNSVDLNAINSILFNLQVNEVSFGGLAPVMFTNWIHPFNYNGIEFRLGVFKEIRSKDKTF